MKIFERRNYKVEGKVLSKDDFRLARDVAEYKIDPSRVAKVLEKAEKNLTETIPELTLSMYRDYLENGSTTVYGRPYRQRMEMAMNLFLAEYVTDSGKYIDKLADVIWATFHRKPFPPPKSPVLQEQRKLPCPG